MSSTCTSPLSDRLEAQQRQQVDAELAELLTSFYNDQQQTHPSVSVVRATALAAFLQAGNLPLSNSQDYNSECELTPSSSLSDGIIIQPMDMHTCIDEQGRNESTRRTIPHNYTPEVPTYCRQPGHSRRIKNCLYKVEFNCCFHQLCIWEGTLQHKCFFVVYLLMTHCA